SRSDQDHNESFKESININVFKEELGNELRNSFVNDLKELGNELRNSFVNDLKELAMNYET
ncbi:3378_t:CDS:1, partial [Ambispora leptoticha]